MLERRLLWLVPLVLTIMGVLGLRNAQKSEDEARLVAEARAATRAGTGPDTAPRPHTQMPVVTANTQAIAAAAPAASLQGTEIDGALHVDGGGAFVPDPAALRFFEYFLSALGELDAASLRARIVQEMASRLPASALPQATRFLDDYLRYRHEAGELGRVSADAEDLHAAVDTLYALRREVFGATLAETLFADDEAQRTVALERRLIASDTSLSPADRAQRLAELDRDLPEPVRQARERATLPLATRDQVEALRARGASDEEVHAAREQALGSEAAERLAAVDRERADFARRLAEFRTRREAILRAPGAKDPAIQTLFERSFAPSERLRASLLTR